MKSENSARLGAPHLISAAFVVLVVATGTCTANVIYPPTSYVPAFGGVGLYNAFPGPYAPIYLHQQALVQSPGFIYAPAPIYNYAPIAGVQETEVSEGGSTVVQADEPANDVPSFKFGLIGRSEARAEILGLGTNGNIRGYVYFSTDPAARGTTVLAVISGMPASKLLVLKIGTSDNCPNATPTDIFNPSSVTGGGVLYSFDSTNTGSNTFYIERSIPDDVISWNGSRSFIGRTVLLTERTLAAPNGITNAYGCGVITRL